MYLRTENWNWLINAKSITTDGRVKPRNKKGGYEKKKKIMCLKDMQNMGSSGI